MLTYTGSANSLAVVVVSFRTPRDLLEKCLLAVANAAKMITVNYEVHLIDNASEFTHWPVPVVPGHLHSGHGNVGFSRANNLGFARSQSDWVLVLNPDATLSPDALSAAFRFLDAHPDVVLLAPAVRDGDEEFQYLNRKRPGWKHLLARGLPGYGRWWGRGMQAEYELRDKDWSVPREDFDVASGCCMLIRRDALEKVGGFDPGFFLYFEDYDLTLRLRELGRVVYLPAFRVVHHGGHVARKSWRHWWYFFRSAIRFSNKHGWRWN